MSCVQFIEEYRGSNVNKDNTVVRDRFWAVVDYDVLSGGSIPILKRKIDKVLSKGSNSA